MEGEEEEVVEVVEVVVEVEVEEEEDPSCPRSNSRPRVLGCRGWSSGHDPCW